MKYGMFGVIPALILIDTAVALARGWRSNSRIDWAFVLLAALPLILLSLMVAVPRGRRLFDRVATKLCLSVFSLLFAWIIAEVAVGTILTSWAVVPFHLHYPRLYRVFKPQPGLMPGIEGESTFTTNDLGIRGPDLPPRDDTYRILCVGGSTTICTYLDDTEAWPYVFMKSLNEQAANRKFWVGNIGMSGYAALHHIEFLKQSSLEDQMDCLVFLVGVNDVTHTLLGANDVLARGRPEQTFPPVWYSSNILKLVRRVGRWTMETRGDWVEDSAGAKYGNRRRLRQEARKCDELPNLSSALDQYASRIQAMFRICKKKGVRPVFMTQPVLWHEDPNESARSLLWLGMMKDGRYLTAEKLAVAMRLFNDRLRKVCEEVGCLCIDLEPMNGRQEFFYDDAHFNEAGSREVAKRIAEQFTPMPTR